MNLLSIRLQTRVDGGPVWQIECEERRQPAWRMILPTQIADTCRSGRFGSIPIDTGAKDLSSGYGHFRHRLWFAESTPSHGHFDAELPRDLRQSPGAHFQFRPSNGFSDPKLFHQLGELLRLFWCELGRTAPASRLHRFFPWMDDGTSRLSSNEVPSPIGVMVEIAGDHGRSF